MTLEDLREHGVLLPEEEWGSHRLETTVPEWPLAGAFVAAVVLWVLALLGGGGWLTWVAVSAFLAVLYGITWICDRAVMAQRERFRRERREEAEEGAAGRGGSGTGGDGEG